MARFGVSIVKSVSFRGVNQEFSNRYHYEGASMTSSQAAQLAANVAAAEKVFHATDVNFVRYHVWLDTGSPGTSSMLSQGPLSGTGATTPNTSMDRERAVLVRWPAGTDSRGRPVYLRKWYHCCGSFGGITFAASILQQTASFSGSQKTSIESAAASLETVSDGTDAKTLAAPPGRTRAGGAQAHPYLEHHQLGDMWR